MCVNSQRGKLPETASTRKRIHHPGDAYAYNQEQEKGPQNVLDAILPAPPPQETERNGNNSGEKQERLEMRQREFIGEHQPLRPRAAS